MPENSLFKKRVVILSISPAIEIKTGNNMLVVGFGEYIEATDEVKKRINLAQGTPVPNQLAVNTLLIYIPYKKDSELPYKIGSEWNLEVDTKGNITLKAEK